MPKEITNIHDKFFKKIISDKIVAIDFFKLFLPKETSQKLNLSTIKYLETTYINDRLELSFADVLFSCKTVKEKEVQIVILVEHKSYIDKNTPIQTLYYVADGMMQQVIRKEKVKVIIPVVFYHGKNKWEYVNLRDLLDSDFRAYIPSFDTIFVDLYRISDENLAMITNAFLASTLLTQKYSREPKLLAQKLEAIFVALDPKQRNLFRPLTVYFIQLVQLEKSVIFEKINQLEPNIKNAIMSTYDILKQEGIEQGIEQGIIKGVEKVVVTGFQKGISLDIISSLTELSITEIKTILKKHQLNK